MSHKSLPMDVVIHILRFVGRFRISDGEIITLLDKNKYKDIIHFLRNKPLPNFRVFTYGVREKSYSVDLSHGIYIQYKYKFNLNNEIEGMVISLWKRFQFLNKVICN
jgi:hypothetical protein